MKSTIDRSPYRLDGPLAMGFAKLSKPERFAIAQKGGKAAWALGTAHRWNHEEAQATGRKGGTISRRGSRKMLE